MKCIIILKEKLLLGHYCILKKANKSKVAQSSLLWNKNVNCKMNNRQLCNND